MSVYSIQFAYKTPEIKGLWQGPAWQQAPVLDINHFRPEGSVHRPQTQARLLYDENCLYGIFNVQDQYVLSQHTAFQDPTHLDSCVELFIQPGETSGYFNFEFNAGGTLAVFYITDPKRTADGFEAYTRLTAREGRPVRVFHSLSQVVFPEVREPLTWTLEFAIPLTVLAGYVPVERPLAGRTWWGNLFKCGDQTSHPHWAAWNPVAELNFHAPHCFGCLEFASKSS